VPGGEPSPIGPEVAYVVKRTELLREHADAVLELRDRARRAWEEMLGRGVGIMALDGLAPRMAEQAARNNLAVRKGALDAELEEGLARLRGELSRRLARLLEDLEDGREAGGRDDAPERRMDGPTGEG
jgi:hypothetical protein